ncbi:MAG: hypothetical protein [Chaetfec virus UA24_144]|nr:MAG: hypothetical protein [Chaetfec virus UA24_144]
MKGFADRVMGSDQMELVACSVYSEKHHFSYSDTITKGYDPEWERMYTTPGFRLIKNPHK